MVSFAHKLSQIVNKWLLYYREMCEVMYNNDQKLAMTHRAKY